MDRRLVFTLVSIKEAVFMDIVNNSVAEVKGR